MNLRMPKSVLAGKNGEELEVGVSLLKSSTSSNGPTFRPFASLGDLAATRVSLIPY